jgi:nitrite reductase/ring-hydroxylating ferredoxin subunit
MSEYVTVATTDEFEAADSLLVEVEGRPVALFEVDGEYYAIGNTCTHEGGSLCDGMLVDTMVTCPLHGAAFDVTSGEAIGPPADEPVEDYDVTVADGEIRISVLE